MDIHAIPWIPERPTVNFLGLKGVFRSIGDDHSLNHYVQKVRRDILIDVAPVGQAFDLTGNRTTSICM